MTRIPEATGVGAGWSPMLDASQTKHAYRIARVVAERLRDPARLDGAIESARQQTGFPRSVNWRSHCVSQGYAGLALLWGAADATMPGEGWDSVARDHLQCAARAAEQLPRPTYGTYSGLGGLAFTAWSLSRGQTRYHKLLASLDGAVLQLVAVAAEALTRAPQQGVSVSTFDVISGLAGVGRYLLLRKDDARHRASLDALLRCLVVLTEEEHGLPRWHTPPQFISDDTTRQEYPHGNLNCGLAHGIPGPLALLSLAARHGVIVEGHEEAIRRIAEWLVRHRLHDQWGVNWPTVVALGPKLGDRQTIATGERPSRTAWCYGSPGIARALWLAGTALSDEAYRSLAVEAMEAVYQRPLSARQIDSPTFCHGVAGLLQITLRFAHESGAHVFLDATHALLQQMMDAYESESLLGYRNIEPGGRRIDQPGLLDGAAGVALVLLAASAPVEPSWDALFLLS